jgi:acetolactate synthase-1/3 small subunit
VPANPITKEIAQKFNAVIADEKDGTMSLEAVGDKASIEKLLAELKPHGIRELVQSGLVALERGVSTLADRTLTTMGTANESSSDSKTADYQN